MGVMKNIDIFMKKEIIIWAIRAPLLANKTYNCISVQSDILKSN